MVALLKDNGEYSPMPVVYDTKKFEQLAASMKEAPKPVPGLVDAIRKNREQFKTASK
ncbi:hypothetical protein [Rhizobium laguerreae]|uniref:hypothetical protein n=1 Tax=Rhizobium laguerreae TaxID=1076926 RepID=UPI001C9174CB|nr:hypothetical protein [Rhizobium laguerreae]MBY3564135.1 hypothetical protein [Rhizobium laguerreae]